MGWKSLASFGSSPTLRSDFESLSLSRENRTGGSSATSLDITSVLKASTAIQSQIELPRLLKTLVSVLVENAGAEKGVLVMRNFKENYWQIDAELEADKIKVMHSVPLIHSDDSPPRCPINIIEYVAKTTELLVLDNASAKGKFTEDSYIKANEIKSVLCAPLISQGKLTAIIYLENNLITNAFAEERYTIIRMLSSQCAMSIEKSILLENLRRANNELKQFSDACSLFVPTPMIKLLGTFAQCLGSSNETLVR